MILTVTACDFPVFRSVLPDVAYSLPDVPDKRVRPDETGRVNSAFITGAAGDLNGDGILDGAAVLATNSGGSGTFDTVHAILGDAGGGLLDVASVLIGDRIVVQDVEVRDNIVEVSILDRAEDEGFTTEPHIAVGVGLLFEDDSLTQVASFDREPH